MDRYCRICHNTSCDNHGKDVELLGEGWKCNYIPVPTNFDRILSMDCEQFAEFIMLSPEMEFGVCECCEVFRGHGAYTPCGTEDGWCTAELRCNAFKKWLQQPEEEVRDGDR